MRNLVAPHLGSHEQHACPFTLRRRLAAKSARVSENSGKVLVSLRQTGHFGHTAPDLRMYSDSSGSAGRRSIGGLRDDRGRAPVLDGRSAVGSATGSRPRTARRRRAARPTSGPCRSTPRLTFGTTLRTAAPKTPGRSAGVAPWAPMPGASSGPLMSRSYDDRSPSVAPTTAPKEPRGSSPAFSAARCAEHRRADVPAVRADGVLDLGALRVGGQRQHEQPRAALARQRRRPGAASRSRGTARRSARPRTAGSPCAGRPRRTRPWSSRCRRAWRPSATSAPAARASGRSSPVRRCRASRSARRTRSAA